MLESHILPLAADASSGSAMSRERQEQAMLGHYASAAGMPAALSVKRLTEGRPGANVGLAVHAAATSASASTAFELDPAIVIANGRSSTTTASLHGSSANGPSTTLAEASPSPVSPPADSPTSSPSSSIHHFTFSPALLSSRYRSDSGASSSSYGWADTARAGASGAAGGRNRSFSVATMATSLGCWDERHLGGLEGDGGKEVERDVVPVIDHASEAKQPNPNVKGKGRAVETQQDTQIDLPDASSVGAAVDDQEEATPRPPAIALASAGVGDGNCADLVSSTRPPPLATEAPLYQPKRLRAISVDHLSQPSRSPAASPRPSSPMFASAPRSARSRAGSIARSLAGLSSGTRSGSTSPSPASSIRSFGGTSPGPSATGVFRSKMQRSRSSLLNILGGNGSGSGRVNDAAHDDDRAEGSMPTSRPVSRTQIPDPADEPSRKGKGRVKGLVKRYISRTQSAVTVPVVASPNTTQITAPSQTLTAASYSHDDHVDLEIVNASIRRAISDRSRIRRSKSFDGGRKLLRAERDLPLLPREVATVSPTSVPQGMVEIRRAGVADDLAPTSRATKPGTNWFDTLLPKELKVTIFRTLIDEHIRDHEQEVTTGVYKGQRAKTQRWCGEPAGRREIVRLSRVCKTWRSLAFDGQLWSRADLHPYLHQASPSAMSDLLHHVARFLIQVDLHGWRTLPDLALRRALVPAAGVLKLQKLDLRFCNQVSPSTLAGLLAAGPDLRHLDVRGLEAVDWPMIQSLNASCPRLESLDISFCRGAGTLEDEAFSTSGEWRRLTTLKAAGGMLGRGVLRTLAQDLARLETLDLSYSPSITDDELLDLTRMDKDPALETYDLLDSLILPTEVVRLRPMQAGLPAHMASDGGLICRRLLALRHLSLTRCSRITEQGCHYLAYAVPKLELLELAGIGVHLRDDGLVALLNSTPLIRKIDLESAIEVTDKVILALTPPRHASVEKEEHPGLRLESLSLGYASGVTTDALMRLIRGCPRLKHLGLDNTGVSDIVVKEFVRRKAKSTSISVVDCRHISRNVVEALERQTRPRRGWRGWQAVPFHYQDGVRPRSGRDECTELPIVQSFWTWSKVPRTPASLAMSSESKVKIQEIDEGDIDQAILRGEERSCTIM